MITKIRLFFNDLGARREVRYRVKEALPGSWFAQVYGPTYTLKGGKQVLWQWRDVSGCPSHTFNAKSTAVEAAKNAVGKVKAQMIQMRSYHTSKGWEEHDADMIQPSPTLEDPNVGRVRHIAPGVAVVAYESDEPSGVH